MMMLYENYFVKYLGYFSEMTNWKTCREGRFNYILEKK